MNGEIKTINNDNLSFITDVYDKLCDFEDLYISHLNARKQKRYRNEIMVFTDNLEQQLWSLHRELEEETYRVGKYR